VPGEGKFRDRKIRRSGKQQLVEWQSDTDLVQWGVSQQSGTNATGERLVFCCECGVY